MNLYREKIILSGGVTVSAKVYVMDAKTVATRGGPMSEVIVTVTIPPSQRRKILTTTREFTWRQATFYIRGMVVPIVALGRVDHYEITGVSDGAGPQ